MQKENNVPTGLYWQGKKTEVERISLPFQTIETINESRATREKEKDTLYKGMKNNEAPAWHNRLIWGDNKYVMSSLLDEFAGKIDLIYIDPPFATGADFSLNIEVGDVEWTKEPSSIEEKAYRDTWGKGLDSYLQMMYDRLTLIRDLLDETGSIFVHLDWHVAHNLKLILDEIFGSNFFRNEIIWKRKGGSANPQNRLGVVTDSIFWFSKSDDIRFNPQFTLESDEVNKYIEERFNNVDEKGRKFMKSPIVSPNPRPNLTYDYKGYKPPKNGWSISLEIMKEWDKQGKLYFPPKNSGERIYRKIYRDEYIGQPIQNLWTDVFVINPVAHERLNFDTQKPESLLTRIIKMTSNENDLVADFFCGSGTTGAVAEKLNRRWVMADIGRYAIHTTRKRLLGIDGCKPFVVQNLGKYERQYWQGVTFANRKEEQKPLYEYIKFILDLYRAEPLAGCLYIHGKKGKRLVHVGAVDAPVTLSDIESAIDECKKMKQADLDILGWEWEMGLHDVVQGIAKTKGVNLSLKYIPREVMDPRAVAAGDITFYELAYLEAEVTNNKHGELVVELKDFVIPNHDLIPEEVRSKIVYARSL